MATEANNEARQPNPVDIHVGGRIRMRRRLLGMGQQELAQALGLTFQQVQKYENGHNRVSASKLWDIARKLDVEIGFFFHGLAADAGSTCQRGPDANPVQDLVGATGGLEVAQGFLAAPQQGRVAMLAMARAFTGATPAQAA